VRKPRCVFIRKRIEDDGVKNGVNRRRRHDPDPERHDREAGEAWCLDEAPHAELDIAAELFEPGGHVSRAGQPI
jgi:hypothetical protein